MNDFNLGDRVIHPDHGLGTVGWVGTEQIGVEFDHHGKVLLRREGIHLRMATEEDERAALARAEVEDEPGVVAPPEPFFVFEGDETEHYVGSHWNPFFDGVNPVLERLSEIVPVAKRHGGYSEFFPPPTRATAAWTQGALLLASSEAIAGCMGFERRSHQWDHLTPWRSAGGALEETPGRAQEWSERNTGVALVIGLSGSRARPGELRSLFPYCLDGAEHTVTPECVRVWKGGVEAQIEGSLGEASIAFYDMDFVNNRDWYRRGQAYRFILVGLAYSAGPAEVQTFRIPRTPEYFEGMEWLTGRDMRPESGSMEEVFSTEGMAMLTPVEGWDIDDYAFRGPVKSVWGMSMLGVRAWRVRVTVLRLSNYETEDVDLDIIVTERTWAGNAPPRVGQEIDGRMWLQGRLWSTDS